MIYCFIGGMDGSQPAYDLMYYRGHGCVVLYTWVNQYVEFYTKANQFMFYCIIGAMGGLYSIHGSHYIELYIKGTSL